MMIVLSLCDLTGNMVRPWSKRGYECWTVDIQHPEGIGRKVDNIRKVGVNVAKLLPLLKDEKVAISFAFPPCTHLAISGTAWFKKKGLHKLANAIRVVAYCKEIVEVVSAPYMIENPVSTLSTYWRKPDYKFNPNQYAGYLKHPEKEAYTKKTCLWVGNGFIMPEWKPIFPSLGSKMHFLPPSPERSNLRSATPLGFAIAVYRANKDNVCQQ